MTWASNIRLTLKIVPLILSYIYSQLSHHLLSTLTYRSFRPVRDPLNIVIVGASFTGLHLAKRLARSIPSGYRVVVVERNDHFHYVFNFPRYAVLRGFREGRAFIPYDGLKTFGPDGALEVIQGSVQEVGDGVVVLEGGKRVEWAFLAVAAGAGQNIPARVEGRTKEEGRAELRALQERIAEVGTVAVVGGGAVGVQLSTDIKSWYPGTEVTLVHSRKRLLSGFGEELGGFVEEKLVGMGIRVVLGERPEVLGDLSGKASLRYKNGDTELFDLIVSFPPFEAVTNVKLTNIPIPCTGQTPNSSFLSTFAPGSICPKSGRILVKPSLQILDLESPSANPNIFALGDVAETFGAKMARAGMMQAEIVAANILALIKEKQNGKGSAKQDALKIYHPNCLEGCLKLSLGKDASVFYFQDRDDEMLISGGGGGEDLNVKQGWWLNGVSTKDWDA